MEFTAKAESIISKAFDDRYSTSVVFIAQCNRGR